MEGQKVTFSSENPAGDCPAMVFGDPGTLKKGLILLHAWWGMNEEVQQHGREICEQAGLVVLVPDLYRGKIAVDRETAGHYMADLDWYGAANDVQGAARKLLAMGCHKVGVTGFCMGGALSFLTAATVPEISASAPFYGISKPHLADLTKISIPVQAHFGAKDEVVGLSSPADFYPLEKALDAAGVTFEMFVYDVGHGFAHPSYPTYDEEAATLAFKRMYQFMQNNLG